METGEERRATERRQSSRWVWRERRSGFDRRQRRGSRVAVAWDATLLYLRDNPLALLAILVLANILSLLDLAFTLWALERGAVEANPVMAALIADDPSVATLVKTSVVGAVTILVFLLRRYRLMLTVAVFAVVLFAAIVAYHLFGAFLLT